MQEKHEWPEVCVVGAIKLGQFLKLADLVESGAMARELVQEGDVSVNGQVDTRRGRALEQGDLVEVFSPQGRRGARLRYVEAGDE